MRVLFPVAVAIEFCLSVYSASLWSCRNHVRGWCVCLRFSLYSDPCRYLAQLCALPPALLSRYWDLAQFQGRTCASVLDNNANAIWSLARANSSNLFASNWAGPAPAGNGDVNIGQETSAAMAVAIYANFLSAQQSLLTAPVSS